VVDSSSGPTDRQLAEMTVDEMMRLKDKKGQERLVANAQAQQSMSIGGYFGTISVLSVITILWAYMYYHMIMWYYGLVYSPAHINATFADNMLLLFFVGVPIVMTRDIYMGLARRATRSIKLAVRDDRYSDGLVSIVTSSFPGVDLQSMWNYLSVRSIAAIVTIAKYLSYIPIVLALLILLISIGAGNNLYTRNALAPIRTFDWLGGLGLGDVSAFFGYMPSRPVIETYIPPSNANVPPMYGGLRY
jgi:hypothetical protein